MRLTIAAIGCLASLIPWAQSAETRRIITEADALLACRKFAEHSDYSVLPGGNAGHLDGVPSRFVSVEAVDKQGQLVTAICEYTLTPLHLKNVMYTPSDCDCVSWFESQESLAEFNAELAKQK